MASGSDNALRHQTAFVIERLSGCIDYGKGKGEDKYENKDGKDKGKDKKRKPIWKASKRVERKSWSQAQVADRVAFESWGLNCLGDCRGMIKIPRLGV